MPSQQPEPEIYLPGDSKKKKKLHPILDWALSLGIIIGIIGALLFVFANEATARKITDMAFTKTGAIVVAAIFIAIGAIRQIIHNKKMIKVKKEIRERTEKDWGKTPG